MNISEGDHATFIFGQMYILHNVETTVQKIGVFAALFVLDGAQLYSSPVGLDQGELNI